MTSEYKHTIPRKIKGYKRYRCNSIISILLETTISISENHDIIFFEKAEIFCSGIVLYRCNGKDVTNLKDHEIIALFFERSERAITELINKYGAAIKNVASNILKDAQDAEEAANDTYLTVWRYISHYLESDSADETKVSGCVFLPYCQESQFEAVLCEHCRKA